MIKIFAEWHLIWVLKAMSKNGSTKLCYGLFKHSFSDNDIKIRYLQFYNYSSGRGEMKS